VPPQEVRENMPPPAGVPAASSPAAPAASSPPAFPPFPPAASLAASPPSPTASTAAVLPVELPLAPRHAPPPLRRRHPVDHHRAVTAQIETESKL
jgi:hypothetical protein